LQFYILTPFLYFLLLRYPRYLAAIFVASLAANFYVCFYLDRSNILMKLLSVSFLPWVYMFILGSIAAQYRELAETYKKRFRLSWLIIAYIVSMNVIVSYEHNARNAINPISFFLLAACILKLSTERLFLPDAFKKYIARNDFSYGAYLYHIPVINVLIYLSPF